MIRLRSGGSGRRPRRRSFTVFTAAYVLSCFGGALAIPRLAGARPGDLSALIVLLFMAETALAICFIPLLSVRAGGSIRKLLRACCIVPAGWSIWRLTVSALARPLRITLVLILAPCAAVLTAGALSGGVPVSISLGATAVVLAVAWCSLTAGFLCAVVYKDALGAAGMALFLAMLISTEPVWFGPAIDCASDASWMIKPSLLVNPFVGVASALDFDLFRTDPFYQICPIGQRRFDYPAWQSVAGTAMLASFLLLWRSIVGIRKLAMPSS
jgi:hypothetical protein